MSRPSLPPLPTPPAEPLPPLQRAAAPAPSFSSIQSTDLVAIVEAQLQAAILAGQIAPGARLVEAELARQMGISRAPVREAARRLESRGLVVSRPRHGFAVRQFSSKEVVDLYTVRIELELMGAALACERASDAQLAALLPMVDVMVQQAPQMTRAERAATDLAFHAYISALSGNDYLVRLFGNLSNEVRMLLALTEDSYGDLSDLADTHRPIAVALQRRDAAAATAALRYHLEVAREHVQGVDGVVHLSAATPPSPAAAKPPTATATATAAAAANGTTTTTTTTTTTGTGTGTEIGAGTATPPAAPSRTPARPAPSDPPAHK